MRARFLPVFLIAATACSRAPVPAHEPIHGAASVDQPASRAIAQAILDRGGSAADAAIAAILAVGVENPSSSGIGGGGFAVIWDARTSRAWALDFRESAPRGASDDHYLGPDGKYLPESSKVGCYAAGVPGTIAGMAALHARFGVLPWAELVDPARKLAADGIVVSEYLAKQSREERETLASTGLTDYLRADGSPLQPGDVVKQPELAETLARIESGGAAGFYRGDVAASIQAACADHPGAIDAVDLADYEVHWRAPVVTRWHGFDVVGMPAPDAGGTILAETLNVLEPWDLRRSGPDAARDDHRIAEALKDAFADRATAFGDPDFVPVDTVELLSKDYAAQLRSRIDDDHVRPHEQYGRAGLEAAPPHDQGTTHVSTVDALGDAVAVTESVNGIFGAYVRTPKTGVLLDNTIDDFSFGGSGNLYALVGSDKNAIGPGRRPVSTMTPTIVLKDGRVRLVAGGAGGGRIASATLSAVLGVLGEGMDAQSAVDAPRLHHQWTPDQLVHEPGFDAATLAGLEKRGHVLKEDPYIAAIDVVEVAGDRAIATVDRRKEHPPASVKPVAAPDRAAMLSSLCFADKLSGVPRGAPDRAAKIDAWVRARVKDPELVSLWQKKGKALADAAAKAGMKDCPAAR